MITSNNLLFAISLIDFSKYYISLSISFLISISRPAFDRDVYSIMVQESAKSGDKIGQIQAEDPDSNEFGREGLIYQLVGTGSKK